MNESLAGSNEWIQPSFALTPQAVFTFSETQGCYLEKLLRNKDIPPGRRGFHVFETPLPSIPSLQVGWGGERSRDVWGTSAPKSRAPAPRSSEWTLQADRSPACLFVVVIELFWRKALKRGCVLLLRNFCVSWCSDPNAALRNLALENDSLGLLIPGRKCSHVQKGGVTK